MKIFCCVIVVKKCVLWKLSVLPSSGKIKYIAVGSIRWSHSLSSVIEVEPASIICFLTSKHWWKMFSVCGSFVSVIHLKGLIPKHAGDDTAYCSTFLETYQFHWNAHMLIQCMMQSVQPTVIRE
jgi:hypothetical protein